MKECEARIVSSELDNLNLQFILVQLRGFSPYFNTLGREGKLRELYDSCMYVSNTCIQTFGLSDLHDMY